MWGEGNARAPPDYPTTTRRSWRGFAKVLRLIGRVQFRKDLQFPMASDAAIKGIITIEQTVPSAHPSRLRASTEHLRGLVGVHLVWRKERGLTCIQEMSSQESSRKSCRNGRRSYPGGEPQRTLFSALSGPFSLRLEWIGRIFLLSVSA